MTSPKSPISPEERARDIMDAACLPEALYKNGTDGQIRKDIAQAIRQAENGALERAAKEAEEYLTIGSIPQRIRELRHKDTP